MPLCLLALAIGCGQNHEKPLLNAVQLKDAVIKEDSYTDFVSNFYNNIIIYHSLDTQQINHINELANLVKNDNSYENASALNLALKQVGFDGNIPSYIEKLKSIISAKYRYNEDGLLIILNEGVADYSNDHQVVNTTNRITVRTSEHWS